MASSAVFWTAFLDLFVCPSCRSHLSQRAGGLSNRRRQHRRAAAAASVDVIPYYSPSLQKVAACRGLKDSHERERSKQLQTLDDVELDLGGVEGGLATSHKDPAVYLGEDRKWPVREDPDRSETVVSNTVRELQSPAANGAVFSGGGASLWHSGGLQKSGVQQGPALSSRYLRIATYLREQGLVLNRAIHRFVGEQSLAEVQAKFATLWGLGCDEAQTASMVQR